MASSGVLHHRYRATRVRRAASVAPWRASGDSSATRSRLVVQRAEIGPIAIRHRLDQGPVAHGREQRAGHVSAQRNQAGRRVTHGRKHGGPWRARLARLLRVHVASLFRLVGTSDARKRSGKDAPVNASRRHSLSVRQYVVSLAADHDRALVAANELLRSLVATVEGAARTPTINRGRAARQSFGHDACASTYAPCARASIRYSAPCADAGEHSPRSGTDATQSPTHSVRVVVHGGASAKT